MLNCFSKKLQDHATGQNRRNKVTIRHAKKNFVNTQGGILRRENSRFLSKFLLSDKIVRFCEDFLLFPGKFPVFCVLILPPGGYIKTAKTAVFLTEIFNGNFEGKNGRFFDRNNSISKIFPFSREILCFRRLNIAPQGYVILSSVS